MGQCNFSGQRDRSYLIVPEQRKMGPVQNLTKGRDRLGQHVKIQEGTRNRMVQDFDILSCHVSRNKTGKSIKGCSITGIGLSKTEKDVLKQEKLF